MARLTVHSRIVTVTIAVEAGFPSFPSMLFYLQLSCPQPESMIAYQVAGIYLFNILPTAVIAVVANAVMRRHSSTQPSTSVDEIDVDASPRVFESYSVTAKNVTKATETGDSGVDNEFYRSESYSSLPEKY